MMSDSRSSNSTTNGSPTQKYNDERPDSALSGSNLSESRPVTPEPGALDTENLEIPRHNNTHIAAQNMRSAIMRKLTKENQQYLDTDLLDKAILQLSDKNPDFKKTVLQFMHTTPRIISQHMDSNLDIYKKSEEMLSNYLLDKVTDNLSKARHKFGLDEYLHSLESSFSTGQQLREISNMTGIFKNPTTSDNIKNFERHIDVLCAQVHSQTLDIANNAISFVLPLKQRTKIYTEHLIKSSPQEKRMFEEKTGISLKLPHDQIQQKLFSKLEAQDVGSLAHSQNTDVVDALIQATTPNLLSKYRQNRDSQNIKAVQSEQDLVSSIGLESEFLRSSIKDYLKQHPDFGNDIAKNANNEKFISEMAGALFKKAQSNLQYGDSASSPINNSHLVTSILDKYNSRIVSRTEESRGY